MRKSDGKLKILGHEVVVQFIEGMTHHNSHCGTESMTRLQIRIDPELPYTRQVEVLFHELVELGNDSNEWGLEHSVITSLASYWAHVFLDNDLNQVLKGEF